MTLQELMIKEDKIFDLQGNEVSAKPIERPQTITGFPGKEDLEKGAVEQILERVVKECSFTDANAYVRGAVDKRDDKDPPYVPIQFYKLT
jgi:hypothetical protein